MIDPGIDVASSTDEQILDAYMRDGMTRRDAEVYLAVLRNASPDFPID